MIISVIKNKYNLGDILIIFPGNRLQKVINFDIISTYFIMTQILIVDFGSQYTFLIAKQIRKSGYYCEIVTPLQIQHKQVILSNIKMVILSGGPQSVYSSTFKPIYDNSITEIGKIILDSTVCVLGICFGLQYICHFLGGKVVQGRKGEYGKSQMTINDQHQHNPLISWVFSNFSNFVTPPIKKRKQSKQFYKSSSAKIIHVDTHTADIQVDVWMSHQDKVVELPKNFIILGSTNDCEHAFIANDQLKLYGMQFHPEVKNTFKGKNYIKSLLEKVCKCEKNWNNVSKIKECEQYLKKTVTDSSNVIMGLSGGVDSTVVAFLLKRCFDASRFSCVLINHGMMRYHEVEEIEEVCEKTGITLTTLDMSELFLSRLKGIIDPEEKRKIIGHAFIESFENYIKTLTKSNNNIKWMLGQGTIYPDVVESAKSNSSQQVIKSHHNVGGLPEKMGMKLVEPLRMLFKNEVRKIGKQIGVPNSILRRHPFPGPGLGIRIIGSITQEKIEIVQKADKIFIDELYKCDLYNKISQAYAGLLDSKSVGVVGDQRRYGWIVCLRAVNTKDFMTATAYRFDGSNASFLEDVSTKIVNAIPQVSRVMYDVTSKPPGTIELE